VLSEFVEIAGQKMHNTCTGMIFAHAREKSLLSNREVPKTFFVRCLRLPQGTSLSRVLLTE